LCVGLASESALAVTEDDINVETVNDYSYVTGGHGDDTICNSEGDGFWNSMASSPDFVRTQHYYDNNVTDRDFHDRDRSGDLADLVM
jgi:hypothetical protein